MVFPSPAAGLAHQAGDGEARHAARVGIGHGRTQDGRDEVARRVGVRREHRRQGSLRQCVENRLVVERSDPGEEVIRDTAERRSRGELATGGEIERHAGHALGLVPGAIFEIGLANGVGVGNEANLVGALQRQRRRGIDRCDRLPGGHEVLPTARHRAAGTDDRNALLGLGVGIRDGCGRNQRGGFASGDHVFAVQEEDRRHANGGGFLGNTEGSDPARAAGQVGGGSGDAGELIPRAVLDAGEARVAGGRGKLHPGGRQQQSCGTETRAAQGAPGRSPIRRVRPDTVGVVRRGDGHTANRCSDVEVAEAGRREVTYLGRLRIGGVGGHRDHPRRAGDIQHGGAVLHRDARRVGREAEGRRIAIGARVGRATVRPRSQVPCAEGDSIGDHTGEPGIRLEVNPCVRISRQQSGIGITRRAKRVPGVAIVRRVEPSAVGRIAPGDRDAGDGREIRIGDVVQAAAAAEIDHGGNERADRTDRRGAVGTDRTKNDAGVNQDRRDVRSRTAALDRGQDFVDAPASGRDDRVGSLAPSEPNGLAGARVGKNHGCRDVAARVPGPGRPTGQRIRVNGGNRAVVPALDKAPARGKDVIERAAVDRDFQHSAVVGRFGVVVV